MSWSSLHHRLPLRERHLVPEQMDADDVDPRELSRALRFIRRINALLRYNQNMARAVGEELNHLAAAGLDGAAVSVLDVAAGSGDLLSDIGAHEVASARQLTLIGLDRHAATVAEGVARGSGKASRTQNTVRFVRGDALTLPFADASVDIVISTLFIHHLDDASAVAALAEMRRVARHAIIVADLVRSKRAYGWITLFTLLASSMVKHDARASVAHAFTMAEARALAAQAGLSDASLRATFGHRFVLTWRRGSRADLSPGA